MLLPYDPDFGEQERTQLPLERFQISDDVADLAGVEAKFRHRRMTGHDTFGERFLEIFDGITRVQRAKRRRDRQWTVAHLPDRVAARAIGANDHQSALRGRRQHLLALGGQGSERDKNCDDVGDDGEADAQLHSL